MEDMALPSVIRDEFIRVDSQFDLQTIISMYEALLPVYFNGKGGLQHIAVVDVRKEIRQSGQNSPVGSGQQTVRRRHIEDG